VIGFNNLLDGSPSEPSKVQRALDRARRLGFSGMHGRRKTAS
jgi:hypothetical protein